MTSTSRERLCQQQEKASVVFVVRIAAGGLITSYLRSIFILFPFEDGGFQAYQGGCGADLGDSPSAGAFISERGRIEHPRRSLS